MAQRIEICFAPGRALSAEDAREFGGEIAEPAILRDYLDLTQGNIFGANERDWWDEGPLATRVTNHIDILDRRHKLNASSKAALRKSQVPDISTFQGLDAARLRFTAVSRASSRVTSFSSLIGLAAPAKGNRHEFYEIKPRNRKGQADGRDKVDNLRGMYSSCGLPYLAGTTYPDAFYAKGIAQIPLLMRSEEHKKQWFSVVKVAMVRENLGRVELFLSVSRKGIPDAGRMPHGLLLYKVCVAIEVVDDKQDHEAVRIARDLVHAWMICLTASLPDPLPKRVREAWLAFEADAITRGTGPEKELEPVATTYTPSFPVVDLSFVEILPSLQSTRVAMRDALISRGICLPGEEYLVCCDESYFAGLAAEVLPILNLITVVNHTPLRWYGYARDRGALGVMEMVVELNSFLTQAKELGVAAWSDFMKWGNENPGKRTVLILVVIVVAAATIYVAAPTVAAELGMGAAAAAPAAELGVTTGGRVALQAATRQTVVRVAMRQEIMREALLQEAAQATLERQVVQQTVQNVVRTTAISTDTAALRSAIVAQAGTQLGREAVNHLIAKAPTIMAAGIGVTIALSGRVAYATENGTSPMMESKGQPIGVQVGRMFLLKADIGQRPVPAALKAIVTSERMVPQIGKEFDAARFSSEADATARQGASGEFRCRYLGKVKVI